MCQAAGIWLHAGSTQQIAPDQPAHTLAASSEGQGQWEWWWQREQMTGLVAKGKGLPSLQNGFLFCNTLREKQHKQQQHGLPVLYQHASVHVSNPSRAVLVPHPSYSLCWIQECLILPVITVHVCTCEEGFLLSLRNSIAINTSTLFHFTGNTKYQSCSCVDKLLSSSAACCHFRSLWLLSCHPENVSPDGNSPLSLPWIILTFSITCKKSILFYSCILGDV